MNGIQLSSISFISAAHNHKEPEQIKEHTIFKRQNSELINEILYLYNREGQLVSSQVHKIDTLV